MKKQTIAIALIATLSLSNMAVAAPQSADIEEREHTEELVGLSSGLVFGAVVGGPVGAFIGAFTGSLIGKSVGDDSEIAAQQAKISEQSSTITAMERNNQSLQEMTQAYNEAQVQLAQIKATQQQVLDELSMGMNVQFKTGSSHIEPIFKQQLDNVAYMMNVSPELTLDLTGYADRRGDSSYNQVLSEQRLLEVTNYLTAQGIDASRLQGQAYGATAPLHQEQNFENDFFDRRVTLKLGAKHGELASN
ncbi:sortase-associated OmpA-like protein PdsO [Shewanella sp. WXL01]|uniref:sortase-associated OmpA-like protein PdsO n=1 Tax=Shewanella sp. WXL01 TaxID=2709721 RepID=UPI00143836A0|nr:sortase-associated OmpA-like protein PdsO [Shewanella sp. WXL01]NKF50494.1 sortase-associated OmpA-like protein PdsO [Shewanella sp. WXL01]